MGNDGGTIAKRQDILSLHSLGGNRNAPTVSADNETVALTTCNISHMGLYGRPVVGDYQGKLFLKEKMLEHLLERPKDDAWKHIRSTKDLVNVTITWKQIDGVATFECPVTRKLKLHNVTYVYLRPCGCVMSNDALEDLIRLEKENVKKEKHKDDKHDVKEDPKSPTFAMSCPLCGVQFHSYDVVIINPLNNPKHKEYNENNYHYINETLQLTHSKQPKKKRKKTEEKENKKRKTK